MDVPKVARVLECRVVDGDTCVLTLDLLFRVRFQVTTRAVGIDTPEKSEEAGKLAKYVCEKWVAAAGPLLWQSVSLDKYGRSLGVLISKNGTLNDYLTQHKIAHPYTGAGKRVWYVEELAAAVASAKQILGLV